MRRQIFVNLWGITVYCFFIILSCNNGSVLPDNPAIILPGDPSVIPQSGAVPTAYTLSYESEPGTGFPVEGHWTIENSPYYIMNNIMIEKGSTLIIDPGVEVIFNGPYWFRIWGGISAVGTESQPIIFTTTEEDIAKGDDWMGWGGIRICGEDYDKYKIDHGEGIYDFRFCEISYVQKIGEEDGKHPWEMVFGNFYVHGTSETDLIFNDNYLHHSKSGLFAYYGASASVLQEGPVFYRNVFEYGSKYAYLQVAHVYKAGISGGTAEHYLPVHFVEGSARQFVGDASSMKQNSTVLDTWDSPVIIDQIEIENCGDSDKWFYSWHTPDDGYFGSITYIEP